MVAAAFVIGDTFAVAAATAAAVVVVVIIAAIDVSFAHIESNEFMDGLSVSVFSLFSVSVVRQFRLSISSNAEVLCDGMFA